MSRWDVRNHPHSVGGRELCLLLLWEGLCVSVRVCLCARAFTTYTMWVSGHSSFGARTVNQQKNSENIAGKDETLKKKSYKKNYSLPYISNFGACWLLISKFALIVRLQEQEEVDTYCWSSLVGHTCRSNAQVPAWPPWGKPYRRCSSAQLLPPHDAHPVARCCSPECDDSPEIRRGGRKKNLCINTWKPCVSCCTVTTSRITAVITPANTIMNHSLKVLWDFSTFQQQSERLVCRAVITEVKSSR